MAHRLDTRTNGAASVFSVKETPWHQLGTVLSEAPSFAEALKVGGLDFEVQLHPMTTQLVGLSGKPITVKVPDHRAVVRMDRVESPILAADQVDDDAEDQNGILGVVGPSYHVLQNTEAFRVLEPLVDSGVATLETGGALRGGRDVWMMVKFNLEDAKVREVLGDEVQPFGLISNNHNGSRKVCLQETPIRVVCANTLGFALGRAGFTRKGHEVSRQIDKAITVRHTTNVKERVVDAANDLFRDLVTRYEIIADQYQALKETTLTEALFAKLVQDVLAPLPEAPKSDRKDNIAKNAFERTTERANKKRTRLAELWTSGDGHQGDHSAWEAYNAATQTLDHDVEMWGAKNRLESLFDGGIATAKQEVVKSLVSYSVSSQN